MFCKRNVGIFIAGILLLVWAYFTYDVNKRFPNPKNISLKAGETTDYKGIKLSAGEEIEIYDYDGLVKQYPQLELVYDLMEDEKEMAGDAYFFLAPVTFHNPTKQEWNMGKESIIMWVLETGNTNNGVDYFVFSELNPDYSGTLEPGETMEIKLPFSITKDYITMEKAMKWDKKIIYSYYPAKNFLYYPGEK